MDDAIDKRSREKRGLSVLVAEDHFGNDRLPEMQTLVLLLLFDTCKLKRGAPGVLIVIVDSVGLGSMHDADA